MSDFAFFPGTYRARCLRVVDGDTADFELDVGFHLRFVGRFRLLGIDTPELNAKDPDERRRAQDARAYLAVLLDAGEPGWRIKLTDVQRDPDNFGRFLARPWFRDSTYGEPDQFNDYDACEALIKAGLALPYVHK